MVKIKLIEDWKAVLWRSWANRFAVLSMLLLIAEQSLPLWHMLPAEARSFFPSWVFGVLPVISMALATYARVVRQEKLQK